MSTQEMLTDNLFLNESSVINSIINSRHIVSFGIIKKLVDDTNMVTVLLSTSTAPSKLEVVTAYYTAFATKSLSIIPKPQVGEKVLLLFPRLFDYRMFNLEQDEVLASGSTDVDGNDVGSFQTYSPYGALALPLSMFIENQYFNTLTLDSGKVDLKLAYNEDDEVNLLTLVTDENGKVTLNNTATETVWDDEGNVQVSLGYDSDNEEFTSVAKLGADGSASFDHEDSSVSVSVDADGNYSAANEKVTLTASKDGDIEAKNDKVDITLGNDGAIKIDNGSATIEVDSSGKITLNAQSTISIKNSSTDLKTVLSDLITVLNSFQTAGSPASHTAVPGQLTGVTAKLNMLLS